MEIDQKKQMIALKEEEKRQKIQDEKKLVDKIYNDYLVHKHPQYPIAKKKLAIEEENPVFDPKEYYQHHQIKPVQPQPAQHKIDTLGKLDNLQAQTIKELDFYNMR